ncbi:hypothetical protein IEQ34_011812 [Dendrobium chrysotoxum]|uniref:La-related protein 6C n=1 Tax=Dendrobium chrysotoxum TaxID=161865 RepID=A0AAV7GTH7_DENCH|nr:hypothetical protein IEQ34_011812 [Dendrobium chrysotoxum]
MEGEKEGDKQTKFKEIQDPSSSAVSEFKLNPYAPAFVPHSIIQMPNPNYFCQYLQFAHGGGGGMGTNFIYFEDQKPMSFVPDSNIKYPNLNMNATDLIQKIVKQVEYQFSDANLIFSDLLVKIMNKDPEGYVPMSVIASWKRIKNLGVDNQMLVKALRTSSQLVVSEDGKKVRRKKLFTEKAKEEQMSRTVVVENLPDDSSHQNIEKLFSVVGSVKNIRICHPQEPNSNRPSKTDVIISNKLHAFVEFETVVQADKAVEKLNDESNWRKGLRVRSLLKLTPRSVIRGKTLDHDHFDLNSEDDQSPLSQKLESPKIEQVLQQDVGENQNGAKKACGRGQGKQTGQVQNNNGRSVLSKTPQETQKIGPGLCENNMKQTSPGPRMPDGTRGFTMGRGKPLKSLTTTTDLSPINP